MRIGLFFGSFNPVHIGHCIIAGHMVHHTDLESVWMVVSPQNPFKETSSLLNEFHRLHLVQLAIENEDKIRATSIEFNLPRPSFTIDTIIYLKEKYPDHIFSIILGSDGLQNFHKWKNASLLAKECTLYVYERPGFKIVNTLQAHIQTIKAPLLEISSTHIREMIKAGKSIRFLVPEKVREEIERCHYYR